MRSASPAVTLPLSSTSQSAAAQLAEPTAVRSAMSASDAVMLPSPEASPQSPPTPNVVVVVIPVVVLVTGVVVVVAPEHDVVAAHRCRLIALFVGSAGSPHSKGRSVVEHVARALQAVAVGSERVGVPMQLFVGPE
jgi:hypothetical protein